MTTDPIRLFDLLHRRALVTRESAQELAVPVAIAAQRGETNVDIVLDFRDVQAVTPSFVDEALGLIMKVSMDFPEKPLSVTFLNPPTRLSSKFAAIARARGVLMEEDAGGWSISRESA